MSNLLPTEGAPTLLSTLMDNLKYFYHDFWEDYGKFKRSSNLDIVVR